MLNSKADFNSLLDKILSPLVPLYSEGGARLKIGGAGATYDNAAMELEAFSRPLWALVPLWLGGGSENDFENIYRRGLSSGADPESGEFWGGFSDYDQRFVEMAAIANGLLLTPEKLWEPLTDKAKTELAAWLYKINEYIIPECNWQFFMILVNLALKKHAMPYSQKRLDEGLKLIDSYYLGGGWYKDGASCQKDYYISFAMHYYALIYARLEENTDPERCKRFRERATEFAKDFIYWFSPDGSAIPFGRSLCYRFAQCSFWSACLFSGIEPFPVDVMKGLIVRNLEWWLEKEIFDRDGVLNLGYGYQNLIMSERYNAPGSPYWSMKSFLFLSLPDKHEFWQVSPAPLPRLSAVKPLIHADMLMHRMGDDVIAYTPGSCELYGHGHLIEKYSKFAYSTLYPPSMARSSFVLSEACPDSMLAFIVDDTVFVRKRSERFIVRENEVYSEWSPLPGIQVKSTVTPTKTGHIRRHEITSEITCEAADLGFAVPRFSESGFSEEEGEDFSLAKTDKHYCKVSGKGAVLGYEVLKCDPNTNLLFKNTSIPLVRYSIPKGSVSLTTAIHTVFG